MRDRRPVKVLVVDASPSYRAALVDALRVQPNLVVVGQASDAFEARELIVAHEPDVMTLDLDIPRMNGVEFLRRLMPQWPLPTVLLSDNKGRGPEMARAAMGLGAVERVHRVSSAQSDFQSMILELVPKLRLAATTDVSHWKRPSGLSVDGSSKGAMDWIICIGASTGGTEAIREVVGGFPADTPGVVIVQHMPAEFTGPFAERLNRECAMSAKEAAHGDLVLPGRILLAPGDLHMRLKPHGDGFRVSVSEGSKVCGHRPSVEVLFQSVAQVAGPRAVGVMLTGMGGDGADGMAEMRRSGARTIAQDEATSVVFGMPRVAIERGGVEQIKPLNRIAEAVLALTHQPVPRGQRRGAA